MHTRIPTLAVALIVAACGGGSSSSPTAASPAAPPVPSSATQWKVTQRFVSVAVTGADNCWVREQRQRLTGAVFPNYR